MEDVKSGVVAGHLTTQRAAAPTVPNVTTQRAAAAPTVPNVSTQRAAAPTVPNAMLTAGERMQRKQLKKQIKMAKRAKRAQNKLISLDNKAREEAALAEFERKGINSKCIKKPSKALKNRDKMYARKLINLQRKKDLLLAAAAVPPTPPAAAPPAAAAGVKKTLNETKSSPHNSPFQRAHFITSEVCNRLFSNMSYRSSPTTAKKAGQQLLRHMAKGTQELTMMVATEEKKTKENEHIALTPEQAIWGYSKYKFAKRSMLTFNILRHIQPRENHRSLNRGGNCPRQPSVPSFLWAQLSTVRTVVSIGGGPGNNLFGVDLFHHLYFLNDPESNNKQHALNLMVLDYAEEGWAAVVEKVAHLSEEFLGGKDKDADQKSRYSCHHCDVTLPLQNDHNGPAQQYLKVADLIIVSYLLTETRGKWHQFMLEAWRSALPGTLFMLMEPTVWQHHVLLEVLGIAVANKESRNAKTNMDKDKDRDKNKDKEGVFLPDKHVYYWWLDEVDKAWVGDGASTPHTLDFVDLGETLERQGPGILLIRKKGLVGPTV